MMAVAIKVMVTVICAVDLCLGNKRVHPGWVFQEVQSCTSFPLLEGLVCKSPEAGCDQMSEAMRLCGCGPSSGCGEYLPRERRSCDVQDGPQLWNATTLLWDEHLPREVGMERCF